MSNNKTPMNWLSALGALVVIGLIIYLGDAIRSVETVEERLRFREPDLLSAPDVDGASVRSTYVPAYSHIYAGGGQPYLLEAVLSIRNTDPEASLAIHAVDYHDSRGRVQRRYLTEPVALAPMSSANYLAEKRDTSGGSGASFRVQWSKPAGASRPLIEAVMIGSSEGRQMSFTSRGVVVE